jgi:hypothetical protein
VPGYAWKSSEGLGAKPPESEWKPPQCDFKATSMRVDSQAVATPMRLQSHPKAPTMRLQSQVQTNGKREEGKAIRRKMEVTEIM